MSRHVRWIFVFLGVVTLLACGGGGGGESPGRPPLRFEDGVLWAEGKDLYLTVPEGLAPSPQLREYVYWAAAAQPGCQDPTDNTVDFLVAQACLEFHDRYLEPGRLPTDLSALPEETVAVYVEAVKAASPDPKYEFSGYYPPEEVRELQTPLLTGERALVGMELSVREGDTVPTVDRVLPYSRAWWDGVQAGDRLLGVRRPGQDPVWFEGRTLEEVLDALPHAEAEEATLILERDGQELEIPTASETHIERLLDGSVAYLGVRRFTLRTALEVAEDYRRLQEEAGKLSGVVLDLRANSGGSLLGAVQLADFLTGQDREGDPMLALRDVYGLETLFRFGDEWPAPDLAQGTPYYPDPELPVAVLVDGGSASAAEIVAAVLRYTGRAALVGETTFGKGVSQDVVDLADGSVVLIPSRWVLLPDGTSWHGKGLAPDEPVAAPGEGSSPDRDPQRDAALRILGADGAPPAARESLLARIPKR